MACKETDEPLEGLTDIWKSKAPLLPMGGYVLFIASNCYLYISLISPSFMKGCFSELDRQYNGSILTAFQGNKVFELAVNLLRGNFKTVSICTCSLQFSDHWCIFAYTVKFL